MTLRLLAPLCVLVLSSWTVGCADRAEAPFDGRSAIDRGATERRSVLSDTALDTVHVGSESSATPTAGSGDVVGGLPAMALVDSNAVLNLGAASHSDDPDLASLCPEAAVASVSDGLVTCTFLDITLPNASAWQECGWSEVFGFGWNLNDQGDAPYACPVGSEIGFLPGEDIGYCIFKVGPMPSDPKMLRFECGRLAEGVLSYSY